jgi:hypothetical protein
MIFSGGDTINQSFAQQKKKIIIINDIMFFNIIYSQLDIYFGERTAPCVI